MTETISEKHEREKKELEAKIAEMLAAATTKNERKRINKQAEQMRRELFDKQSQETDDPFLQSIIDTASNEPNTTAPPPKQATSEPPKKSQEQIERKRQQRMKKMQRKYQQEAEFEEVKNMKTKGQIEQEQMAEQLAKINLKMHSNIGDGNCLYRAFAYSLLKKGFQEYRDPNSFKEIRKRAADELRSNESQYFNFSNCSNHEEYEHYCEIVENSAEWGDELELTAISNAFKYTIVVHRVGQPPLNRGEFSQSIDLAFLPNFTTSGGHYNAVIPISETE